MKTRFLIIFVIGMVSLVGIPYSYASCAAPLLGPLGPCFDSFSMSGLPLTEKSIMEDYARNIELNYGDWQISNRNWAHVDSELELPAIICTEFVADGMKQYRMAQWVDSHTISSFENHRDDSLCDRWLSPIDDGVKIKWDKPNYSSNDMGTVTVIDKDMNLDDKKIDSFDIHVWSDTDHKGTQITMSETDNDTGIFESTVYFTTENESSGTTLLVEDAVYAEHKSNVNFSRIIYDPETQHAAKILDEYGNPVCLGGRNMIINDQCERIGNYDIQTGIPIVNNKSECDKLDGTWYDDRKLCDSKYAPVEYRFQFGPATNVYDESEEMRMASEKVYTIEEGMGGGSGTAIFNEYSIHISIIMIGIVLGAGSSFGLMIFWRKRK